MTKTILCYGDSNTWGYNPANEARHAKADRWTSVLANNLGEDFDIIPEGLNGRTTVWDDPIERGRDGMMTLFPLLLSHAPLDLVIIMLGTNDLKMRFNLPPSDIAKGAGELVKVVQHTPKAGHDEIAPQVLLVAPLNCTFLDEDYAELFFRAEDKAKHFPREFKKIADELGCFYADAAQYAEPVIDGIHLDAAGQHALGEGITQHVREIFGL